MTDIRIPRGTCICGVDIWPVTVGTTNTVAWVDSDHGTLCYPDAIGSDGAATHEPLTEADIDPFTVLP